MLILFLLHHPRLISKPLYKLCQCLLHLPLMLSPNCQHSSSAEKHLVFATNVVLSGVKITAALQRFYTPSKLYESLCLLLRPPMLLQPMKYIQNSCF